MNLFNSLNATDITLRVNLNPLKKKATSSLVRNVMINFPTLFLKWYQKHVKVRFVYLLGMIFFVRARGHCESSHKSARR